ncbi:hypothetical protein C8F01DRAFT_1088599 [Mycena amicta]|nr:hypothetical protein C8F01DRAFT_1088599 [Mycena amicta]
MNTQPQQDNQSGTGGPPGAWGGHREVVPPSCQRLRAASITSRSRGKMGPSPDLPTRGLTDSGPSTPAPSKNGYGEQLSHPSSQDIGGVSGRSTSRCKFWGLSQDLRGPKTWVEYIAHGFTQTVGGTKAGHVTDALDPPMLRVVSSALGGWNQRDFPNWDAGRCPSNASQTSLDNIMMVQCQRQARSSEIRARGRPTPSDPPAARIDLSISAIDPSTPLLSTTPSTAASTAVVSRSPSTTRVPHSASTLRAPLQRPKWPDRGPVVAAAEALSMPCSYRPNAMVRVSTSSKSGLPTTYVVDCASITVAAEGRTSSACWRIVSRGALSLSVYSTHTTKECTPGWDIGSANSALAATVSSFVLALVVESERLSGYLRCTLRSLVGKLKGKN